MQGAGSTHAELSQIQVALSAEVLTGVDKLGAGVPHVYASDLMSDVLAYGKPGSILLTGLNSQQSIISAYMAEFSAVVFIRGKRPGPNICKFAEEKGLAVLTTKYDMFEACAKLAVLDHTSASTLKTLALPKTEESTMGYDFSIDGKDFANAGMVSTQVKIILKTIGYDPVPVRRVAISTYEGEMNVVMHALRADARLVVSEKDIIVTIEDQGKGIPDVKRAMEEGFSTATEEQRAMGFGSGMGLPNIKRNADVLNITSEVGKGTRLEIKFYVK